MNTKLIVALVVVGVLALTVVGLVAAQAASTSAPNGTTGTAQSGGFFGWMGRCLGFQKQLTVAHTTTGDKRRQTLVQHNWSTREHNRH